ncbi:MULTISPECIES: carotenoid oxygenase family protein [Actinomadura]|uniref:Dioxygenase n=1 Tax=Actinomadura yumaensis TaxID=111807 RepID=A0ABW2CHQ0_9ACTN|nr:carotenoid oxygenase family protein [Actinomadura sp. J1-007]MWK34839.1 dioxygenase [Actinomadura sp. J1-007]
MPQQISRRHALATGLAAGTAFGAVAVGAAPARAAQPAAPTPGRSGGENPFLEGQFAPVPFEVTEFDLAVSGTVPKDLTGRLLRNGPNVLGLEDPRAHHWLTGDGMVHGVQLRDGKAEWYRSRWVRAKGTAEKLGEPVRGKPAETDFPSNVHVIGFQGRTFALQEGTARPQELTNELYTVGPCDFNGTWAGTMSAHTKLDPDSGELHSVSYNESTDYVQYVVVGTNGKVKSSRNIPMGGTILMHDFALTEKYVVLYDQPIMFDLDAMQHGQKIPWVWDEKRPSRVGYFPRAGGPVTWITVRPSYISHTLNAYDDGGNIVVDFVEFPAPFSADRLSTSAPPALVRWTIDRARGRVRRDQLDDRPQEFPRVPDARVGRKHRYGYTAAAAEFLKSYGHGSTPDSAFSNGLVKHDLATGRSQLHRFPRYASASEAVFVPRSGARGEDDGYVMSYVHNPDRNASDLVILSAQDFTAKPIARIHLPSRIPLGLHGSWIAGT